MYYVGIYCPCPITKPKVFYKPNSGVVCQKIPNSIPEKDKVKKLIVEGTYTAMRFVTI